MLIPSRAEPSGLPSPVDLSAPMPTCPAKVARSLWPCQLPALSTYLCSPVPALAPAIPVESSDTHLPATPSPPPHPPPPQTHPPHPHPVPTTSSASPPLTDPPLTHPLCPHPL